MAEYIFLVGVGIAVGVLLFKINHPEFKWGCLIGLHEYRYSHQKNGMHIDTKSNRVIGTKRRVYTCDCGHQKAANPNDWIK